MKKTGYQEFVVKTLLSQLNDPWIRDNIQHNASFKLSIKHMIRHYPEYNYDGEKAYRNVEKSLKHHRVTTRAAKVLDNGGNYGDIHPEHIYPNDLIFKDILRVCQNEGVIEQKDIVNILSKSEVIIISKEEKNVLDGSVEKMYPLDGEMVYGCGLRSKGTAEERLNCIKATFDPRYENNTL